MKHANVAIFVPHIGCPHCCSFCDQRAITGQSGAPTAREVRAAAEAAEQHLGVAARQAEIAFFGGSFTAIDAEYQEELLAAAWEYVREGRFAGIRISTRPDAIDQETLCRLRAYGVTAVELGAQSMDNRVLRLNHRGHTARQVEEAAGKIQGAGFSLGLQMMTGLFGDTPAGALETAGRLAALHPDTVRIYPTIVMKGTELARLVAAGEYRPMGLAETVELCAHLLDLFEERGIRVIRLGLHAGEGVEQNRLAGPWHPAFRELCESRRLALRALPLLRRALPTGGRAALWVHPRALSQMLGQKKSNLAAFQAEGYHVIIKTNASLGRGEIRVTEVEACS